MTGTKIFIINFTAVIFFLSGSTMVRAQQPPQVQPSLWQLDTSRSDEFNEATLDTSKWWALDPCNYTDSIYHGYNWSGGAQFRPKNVALNNGNVVITINYNADSLHDSIPCFHNHYYRFNSGGIQSKQTRQPNLGTIGTYTYGYYEMRAKLPGYYNINNQSRGLGFWPTFWFYYQHVTNGCVDKHDEVDILEPGPSQYYDAKANVAGWHDEIACATYKPGQDSMRCATPLFENFHKYAVESFQDKIIFYFDDQPFFYTDTITSPQYTHSLNFSPYLAVVMNVAVGNGPYPMPDTPFPQFMYIDYFRYYQLKPDPALENLLFQNYPNPSKNTVQIGYNVINSSNSAFIKMYDVTGREIKSVELVNKGKSKITIDLSNFSSGAYVYSLWVDNTFIDAKKMIVLK